jgi:hypothetical protein
MVRRKKNSKKMQKSAKNTAKIMRNNAKNNARIMQNNAGVRESGTAYVLQFQGLTPPRRSFFPTDANSYTGRLHPFRDLILQTGTFEVRENRRKNKPRGRPFQPGNQFGQGRPKGSRNRPKLGDIRSPLLLIPAQPGDSAVPGFTLRPLSARQARALQRRSRVPD